MSRSEIYGGFKWVMKAHYDKYFMNICLFFWAFFYDSFEESGKKSTMATKS